MGVSGDDGNGCVCGCSVCGVDINVGYVVVMESVGG